MILERNTKYISEPESNKVIDGINDGNGKIHVKKFEFEYDGIGMITNPIEISIYYYSKEKVFKEGEATHFKIYYKFKDWHVYITKVEPNNFVDQ